jgi:GNAT superfamily N-acetyltransferase
MNITCRTEQVTDVDRAADVIIRMGEFAFMTMKDKAYEAFLESDIDLSLVIEHWTNKHVSVFTASEDQTIVGMHVWVSTPPIWRPKKLALSAVLNFVLPEYRKNGVGDQLLTYAKGEFSKTYPKGTLMLIDVVTGNPYKEAFERMGFYPMFDRLQGVL